MHKRFNKFYEVFDVLKNFKIGIMQGRLLPKINNKIQAFPENNWKEEFEIAERCKFDSIEWIIDKNNNPLLSDNGIDAVKQILSKFDVEINSICCDYFMENLLFRVTQEEQEKNLQVLKKIITNAHKLDIKILEIPLVDSSSMKNDSEERELIKNVNQIIPLIEELNITIGLETDYEPKKILNLLENFDSKNIGLNYDFGNSSSLGYNPKEELSSYGKYIKNIHIKDRKLRGETVPFGEGDADFDLFFSTLKKINYNGELILQGARIENKRPEDTCVEYREFVQRFIERYF